MDQARIEFYLDDGWNLVGRLHQWLSKWPDGSNDRVAIVEILRGLQSFWAMSDDLDVRCLARTSLALEQLLERICAETLEFTTERFNDFTMGVECLQELLLGLEATREVPSPVDLNAILRLERHTLQAVWYVPQEELTIAVPVNDIPTPEVSIPEDLTIADDTTFSTPHVTEETSALNSFNARPLLLILEQFIAKIDETCRRLHLRMLTDEAPYASTTSRLEHLAQFTRDFVDEIVQQTATSDLVNDDEQLQEVEQPLILEESGSECVSHESASPIESAAFSRDAAKFAVMATVTPASNIGEAIIEPHRILIVDESLFFRNLISTIVQSAGYESHAAETGEQGIDALTRSSDFSAILVSSMAWPAMADAIGQSRQASGAKVLGLITSEDEAQEMPDVDGHFVRSRPQQLTSILSRVLGDSSDLTRKIA